MKGDIRCVEGLLWRHDPQHDDPELETNVGVCPDCEGIGCDEIDKQSASAKDVMAVSVPRPNGLTDSSTLDLRERGGAA